MSAPTTTLLDASGRPIVLDRPRARADGGYAGHGPGGRLPLDRRAAAFAYAAADWGGQELAGWYPNVRGPDAEINVDRDRMVGRARDLVRNNGWAAGSVARTTDAAVGAHWRLQARPDFLALARLCAACDATWANELAGAIDAEWRSYADDPAHFCDAKRRLTMTQLFRLGLRHKLIDGENLMVLVWDPARVDSGAHYATALQIVDPDRLCNPYTRPDTDTLRGGVEIDDLGGPVAFHIRRAQPNDWFEASASMIWDRIEAQTAWGRPVVVHDFDVDRTDQHRGVGVLTPVVDRFKMLARYDGAELQQAVLQAAIRTFITSPFDAEGLNLLGGVGAEGIGAYQLGRAEYASEVPTEIGGVRVPRLYPGEKPESIAGAGPGAHFADFEHAVLRSISAATGNSPEQLSQDWSRTNYSSARASLLEAWKTMHRRRGDFVSNSVTPVYVAWLEEALDPVDGRLASLMPRGAPAFAEARAAYARARWIGPARGWVDPVKERQGAVLGLDAGFSTLEHECAEQGLDWRETVAQRAVEVQEFHRRGLKLPVWGTAEDATATDQKPQAA